MNLDNFDINKEIQMDALIENSVFYPGAWSDGRVIQQVNTAWKRQMKDVNCFILCDYLMSERKFIHEHMNTVCGYRVVGHRSLAEHEYLDPEYKVQLKPGAERKYTDTFLGHKESFGKFAHVVLYERDKTHKNVLFGPDRFLLLYTNQEGLYMFQQLYVRRHIRPKVIVFSQIWGFAGNWTDFSSPKGTFAWTLRCHKECVPEWVVVGDYMNYHGAQRLLGTDYLGGVKMVGYDLFKNEGILIHTGPNGSMVSVVEYKGRKYLKYTVSGDMWPVVYDISDSKLPVMKIVDELTLHEQKCLTDSQILNQWVGFEDPINHYANGRPCPELALDITHRSDCYPSYVDDAISIADAVKRVVEDKKVPYYTSRMESFLEDSLRILQDEYKRSKKQSTVAHSMYESRNLLNHMRKSCTKIP